MSKLSKKKSSKQATSPWLTDIWPTERDIMVRPERLKYVRKLLKVDGCVFCNSLKAGVKVRSLLLFKSKYAAVVMNKYPYNPGHLLIIPTRHIGEFEQLKAKELFELNELIQRSIKVLKEAYDPAGFNVGLNLGAAAGAGIPEHLHYHLVPRWKGDTNFFPLISETKVIVESLEQTFERLLPLFKESSDGE